VVYLDCIDHLAPDAEFIRFLTMWVRALPDSVKLAVSSCALTRPPWDALLSEGLAAFVDVELRRTDWAFRAGAPVRPQLECLAFGRGQMCVNGQPIQSWEGVLPRALAFYLIDNPLVSRLEIFEAFWPNVNGNDATNVFHVTKRKVNERISASIGDGKAYELTHYALGFYSASDGLARHYDVEDFCQSVEQALVCEDERRQTLLFLRAIDLYRAPFLQTVEMPWVVARRQDLHRRYVSALVGVGRAFARRGDNRAVMYLSRAVREAPEREDVHRDVIELYVRQGMYAEAEQHLQMLAQRLHEAGGLALPPELVALRAQMRNRHAGA
jgi:DNA-binding SARP family transcriptional activator